MKTEKVNWKNGDLFLIPLKDNTGALGQVLDLQMPTIVRCVIFESILSLKDTPIFENIQLRTDNIISIIACTREQLDFNVWKIIGNSEVTIPIDNFPNEEFRSKKWIGSIHYDASVIEEFVCAYHSLCPWDDWANPNFLDELLISKDKKPKNLILLKSK